MSDIGAASPKALHHPKPTVQGMKTAQQPRLLPMKTNANMTRFKEQCLFHFLSRLHNAGGFRRNSCGELSEPLPTHGTH